MFNWLELQLQEKPEERTEKMNYLDSGLSFWLLPKIAVALLSTRLLNQSIPIQKHHNPVLHASHVGPHLD